MKRSAFALTFSIKNLNFFKSDIVLALSMRKQYLSVSTFVVDFLTCKAEFFKTNI